MLCLVFGQPAVRWGTAHGSILEAAWCGLGVQHGMRIEDST